ncbi:DUF7146 domain-containing protein [Sediminimonas qiaohouensis]|uniref:DUF7146 domain-containing protein n=1 Tax=Sediminimonas qiaohouensis TaxID=552061 RepID=UPI0004209636|nr:primase-helicase zinc-binding domain-containing protein [Sediminimonas qiaohouensis]
MAAREDPRLIEAQAIPIGEIVDRLAIEGLHRTGAEMIGPCPVCGGRDRFGINMQRGVYNCRHCGGGDGIGLVQLVMGCDFKAALSWLVGEAELSIDPAEAERRRREHERKRAAQERDAEKRRKAAMRAAWEIWQQGKPTGGTAAEAYLLRRKLDLPEPSRCLRYHPDLPYMVADPAGGWREIHRGPAMLAAVQGPKGGFIGVHRTWLDLHRPKGKAQIVGPDGEPCQAKKMLGSKKGGAIRLYTPQGATRLIMGEGIETTATAWIANAWPAAAYWAGVDLGNMAGRRILRGQGMKYAGVPDLDDRDAFLPPEWVEHLIFIQDGDSEPRSTRAKLLSGLRRARACRPRVERVSIVHAGDGIDLNDALMGDYTEYDHVRPD